MLNDIYCAGRKHRESVEQYRSLLRLGQEHFPYKKALSIAKGRLLDWGCGNGHLSHFLASNGFKVDAYDVNPGNFIGHEAPPVLQEAENVRFTMGTDPTLLPYPDRSFDVIFCAGVLEHVHEFGGDAGKSVKELSRVLKPGGLLWVYHLPNRYSWNENTKAALTKLGLGTHAVHSALFSRRDFEKLLEGTGLTVEEAKLYHFLPRIVLEKLPRAIVDSPAFCSTFDELDDALSFVLSPIAQNWSFVTRKTQ